jgi:hypothetical protein
MAGDQADLPQGGDRGTAGDVAEEEYMRFFGVPSTYINLNIHELVPFIKQIIVITLESKKVADFDKWEAVGENGWMKKDHVKLAETDRAFLEALIRKSELGYVEGISHTEVRTILKKTN